MDATIAVIQTTLSDRETAELLAGAIIENALAACVQICPDITSMYHWQGNCERASEILLTIKTSTAKEAALCHWLQQHHPYELPEILARHERATSAYAAWVEAETCKAPAGPTNGTSSNRNSP